MRSVVEWEAGLGNLVYRVIKHGWGVAAAAVTVTILLLIACVAMDIEVEADRLFAFFVVALVTFFAIRLVDKRTTGVRIVSRSTAIVASAVHAGAVVIVVWTATLMARLEDDEIGVYVLMFAATFAVHWFMLYMERRRALRE